MSILQEKILSLTSEMLSNLPKMTQLIRQILNLNLELSGSIIYFRNSYLFNIKYFSWVRVHLVSSCPFLFGI